MKRTSNKRPSADQIARAAEQGEDVTRFFAGKGRMMPPLERPDIQRVNVDFTVQMLGELDAEAVQLNISRQAVIKTLLRRGLDEIRERRGGVRPGIVRTALRSKTGAASSARDSSRRKDTSARHDLSGRKARPGGSPPRI